MPAKVSMEPLKITPKMAKEWLEQNNTNNRSISKSTVTLYARQMKEGRWVLNGEAIMFDDKGDLLNGQHRLAAIVEANKTVEIFVGRGFPPDFRNTVDQHRKRTAGDVLRMNGYMNGSHLAGVARVVNRWDQGVRGAGLVGGSGMISPVEVLDVLANESLIEPATHFATLADVQRLAPTRAVGALWVLTHRVSPNEAEQFFDSLRTGEMLKAGNPILALRRYWGNLSSQTSGGQIRRHRTSKNAFNYLNSGVRAWNSWARDVEMKMIVWKDHNIPEVEKSTKKAKGEV